MWTAVYMTKNQGSASALKKLLMDNNIIAKIRKSDEYYEILVPSSEVCQAHNIIIDTEI